MSMLLGYFDEYVDSGFITDSSFKNGSGTSQALHDYLFANCLHLILGNDWFGHPMAGLEIKESMTDYLSNKCTASLRSKVTHEYGAILYTHATPRTHINAGYPTLLILTGGEYDKEGAPLKKGHVVPAFGYNEVKDTFLVHMGWWPNKTEEIYNFRSIIVSNATIHSYYTINYTA